MLYAASRAIMVASRFLIAANDWGLGASWSFVFGARAAKPSAGTAVKGLPGRFYHRGRPDKAVLTQFAMDFGYLDPGEHAPISTVVDAGANIGVFSALARRLYPEARILAMEIEPANLAILSRNAEGIGGVEVIAMALWKERATLNIVFGATPDGHSVTDTLSSADGRVEAMSLHDLMDQFGLPEIDVLKMDIEGAESEVIQALSDEDLSRINSIRFECADSDSAGNTLRICGRLLNEDFDAFAFGENVHLVRRRTGWIFRRHYAGVGAIPSFGSTHR